MDELERAGPGVRSASSLHACTPVRFYMARATRHMSGVCFRIIYNSSLMDQREQQQSFSTLLAF